MENLENPQVESATSSGFPKFNNCRACFRMSQITQDMDSDAVELEKFLRDSLPELHFVEAMKLWGFSSGELTPSKGLETLTWHLLKSYFDHQIHHVNPPFSIGHCHGPEFKNCVAYFAIKKEVHKVFPHHADAEFDGYVQSWFNQRTNSSEVIGIGTHRAAPKCTICVKRLENQQILTDDRTDLETMWLSCCPKNCLNLRDMVNGFLENFILRDHLTAPLTLTKNCFGNNFETCVVMFLIQERGSKLFPKDGCNAYNYVKDWFNGQIKSFEDIVSIAMVVKQEETNPSPKVIQIYLAEEKKKDEVTMICSILDYILKKHYVGFVLSCRMTKSIPNCLGQEIHRVIVGTFAKIQMEIYEEYVKKWFQSKE